MIEMETSAEFLANLGKTLCEKEGVDVGLAKILTAHILKGEQVLHAVAQSKDAILKLASERANPPKPEEAHG